MATAATASGSSSKCEACGRPVPSANAQLHELRCPGPSSRREPDDVHVSSADGAPPPAKRQRAEVIVLSSSSSSDDDGDDGETAQCHGVGGTGMDDSDAADLAFFGLQEEQKAKGERVERSRRLTRAAEEVASEAAVRRLLQQEQHHPGRGFGGGVSSGRGRAAMAGGSSNGSSVHRPGWRPQSEVTSLEGRASADA